MTKLIATVAVLSMLLLAACGDDDDDSADATTSTVSTVAQSGPCSAVEELDVEMFGNHDEREFTAADYETNPPAGGDHNPTPLAAGQFYRDGAPLGEAVHLLEHGGVIGWTNGLSRADRRAVEQAFDETFTEGYYQLAVIENPELETPFALSAWGAVQTCDEVDTDAIRAFIEEWYASPKSGESALACEGEARKLPPC